MDKKLQALKTVERITRIKVENVRYKWPPYCTGFLHQPRRPKACKETKVMEKYNDLEY